MRSVTILGSTGSIGTQALDVVRRNPDRFKVVGVSAGGGNQDLLVGQIREFLPPVVAIADEDAAADIKEKLGQIRGVELIVGPDATETLARETEADFVLNALVGSAGLGPTLATLQSGKTLALANKESLVVGGELVTDLIKGEPERLLPVDSEHAALAMALRGERSMLESTGRPLPLTLDQVGHELAADDEDLLFGQGEGLAALQGRERGAEPGRPHQRVEYEIGLGTGSPSHPARRSAPTRGSARASP